MKKINILLIAVCTLLFASCEGFLDVPPTNQADAATSIQTAADADVFMNGIMRKMSSSSYYGRNMFLYGDAKGGDFAIASQGRGSDGLYTFNHTPLSGTYSGFWTQIYHCLLQVNTLLENIENIDAEASGENLDSYKGQALTLRALMYFDLVRLYGLPYNMDKSSFGVPMALEPLDASAQLGRASVEEVYAQIVADLTEGANYLSKSKTPGYINYYGNKAILSRVYLYMEKWSEALAAAEEVMTGSYSLYSNANWEASWAEQHGSESIFEIEMYPDEADLGTGSLGYYLRRHGHGSTSAMGWFMASDYFLARLGQDPTDVRWSVMDYDEIRNDRFGSCYKYSGGVNRSNTGKSATFPGDGKNQTAVNIKVIRLSEIYLNAAEAAFMANNKTKAAEYLQAIRKRAAALEPATAGNITMQMIKDERSKELFAEGQRFFDMMRWNETITFNDDLIVPAVNIPHRGKTINRTFAKIVLPISKDEINANPTLASQQNKGYE